MQIIKSIHTNAETRDAVPISMIVATAVIDAIWSPHTGIVYRAPLLEVLATPMVPLAGALFYTAVRPNRQIAEAALYWTLLLIYASVSVRLSYLGATLNYPLRDADLMQLDAALGFDWRQWCASVSTQDWFRYVQQFAYNSYWWQPFVAIAIFARYRDGRNRELLTSIIIAATVTITAGSFLPAYGPGHAYGIPAPWDGALETLRSGSREPLPYMGVITFPSLHAAVAVVLTVVHRDFKWTIVPVAVLNLLMLLSLPLDGDHYLSDVLVGAFVGLCSSIAAMALLTAAESLFGRSPRFRTAKEPI